LKIAHICNELKDQIRNYIWMKNKPIDEGDDLIDASRYGYLGWLTSQNLRKEIIEDMPRKTDAMLHVEGLFRPDRARGWMRRI
jgi:hypothetical protein